MVIVSSADDKVQNVVAAMRASNTAVFSRFVPQRIVGLDVSFFVVWSSGVTKSGFLTSFSPFPLNPIPSPAVSKASEFVGHDLPGFNTPVLRISFGECPFCPFFVFQYDLLFHLSVCLHSTSPFSIASVDQALHLSFSSGILASSLLPFPPF